MKKNIPSMKKWLTQLFASGTSLDGAMPKASVRDEHENSL
jgi:hypothetical protein